MFFQTLHLRWEYEPEGFQLSTGDWYLPDFRIWLEDGPLWAEVKPPGASADLFAQFMEDSEPGTRGTVLRDIPDPDVMADGTNIPKGFEFFSPPTGGHDTDYVFCVCRVCRGIGFEYLGRSERMSCCPKPYVPTATAGDYYPKAYTSHYGRLVAAYATARSARVDGQED